jgi:Domain of unknown function (DUF5060)
MRWDHGRSELGKAVDEAFGDCFVDCDRNRLCLVRTPQQGVFERTFTSQKSYADPFNDVDVDVVFSRGQENWRVPTFWRGANP